jgi:two-component system CheB/CheR fusion protein
MKRRNKNSKKSESDPGSQAPKAIETSSPNESPRAEASASPGPVGGDGESKKDAQGIEAPALPAPQADREAHPTAPSGAPEVTAEESGKTAAFPIVGIGASAGGLGAFETFFAHMPADSETGIAFVIVQHLDPDHKSILTELVRRYTKMRVFEVTDGMQVEPNCAYIIRPNKDLALIQCKLHLMEPSVRRGLRLPIDFFFRSLAQDRGEQSIGIILSGNGTDGTLGLRAIKEAGGMAVVQEPQSAEYDGMPRSAIASGLADYVLPPEEMPAQLIAYVKRTSSFKGGPRAAAPPDVSAWLLKIMALLRAHNGHDLSHYKQNTIRRRVERRMVVNQIDTLDNYVRLLRQNPVELEILFRELLIGVTSFFRDPPAFEALRDLALPSLMSERPPGMPIRIWVPGCSTGEEAYSLAMLLHEAAEKLGREFVVQVFATDIDHESIEKARAALYPANIAADISPERLSRFFTQEQNDFYRVKKTLRDQLIFAEQDVIKDPPFSKLDMISCRNMLIYMEPVLQKRLIPLFHYALSPGGFLLLGNSEAVGEFGNLFAVMERKWKLYRRKDLTLTTIGALTVPRLPIAADQPEVSTPAITHKERKPALRDITERMLLRNYSPACVAVNEQGEILYVHGRSGKYLELPSGDATLNVLRAAREGLKIELANALRKVVAQRQPVRYEGLEVRTNGGFETVNVTVELAEGPAGASNLILITFRDVEPRPPAELAPLVPEGAPSSSTPPDEKDRHIAALERELRIKTETLQTTVEELETSNEELKSTNEELQSTNEELQSTNEELETSKEELQSVNEELVTVNTELQQKMEGLSRANNDMNNLLAGTGIGMLFVDHQLRIQRFTPATTQLIKLIQTDIGRPVSDLVSNLADYDRLGEDVKSVLDSLIPREAEVQTRDGHWYLMRVLPYRTVENVIEGAVLTFVDIAAQKRAEEQFRKLSAELEVRVNERVAEVERVNRELQREIHQREHAEARRATDIAALTRIHDLTKQMTSEDARQKLLQASLDAAIELTRADMGTLQLYHEPSKTLRLAAHRGFRQPFLDHFQTVSDETSSSCAHAMHRGERVLIEDIFQSTLLKDTVDLPFLQTAGVRGVQSTPVMSRDGRLLAMFSTHWTKSPHIDEGTLRLLDLLTRQLADLLEAHGSSDRPNVKNR